MSHFLLTVILPLGAKIGDAHEIVERALLPFEEFGANGTESEYVKEVDVTESHRKDFSNPEYAKGRTFREFCEYWTERKAVAHGETPDTEGAHKWGYTRLGPDGEVAQVIDRTNPNAKWDWWVIGGRWDGVLLDEDTRDKNNPVMDGRPQDTGRNVVPVAELKDDYSSFAFLTPEGEWIERGSMGWWGVVHDKKDGVAWKAACRAVLEKYRNHIAVAVDCHT